MTADESKADAGAGAGAGAGASADSLITWRRPCDFFDGEYDVFLHKVEPQDIRQGSLGDCWYACTRSRWHRPWPRP